MELLENIDNNNKYSYYIVGGAIRDILLNLKPKDFDIVTNIPYKQLKEYFDKKGLKTKETGKNFGVLRVKIGGIEFEIANYRKDIYEELGKGATKVEIGTIEDDMKRRDFDVNDLYYNPKTKELLDGNMTGLKNLFLGKFRFVGNPEERFREDGIRLMRAYKLISKKNLIPTKETLKAMRKTENIKLMLETIIKYSPNKFNEIIAEISGLNSLLEKNKLKMNQKINKKIKFN